MRRTDSWKDSDAGKDWRQEEKGATEDEMVGWHHWLNGHEFEQILGVGDRQGGLVCCGPWDLRVAHNWATEPNWTEIYLNVARVENPMDRGAWWAAVHGVAKSQTWLSNFTFTFHFHALEKDAWNLLQCSCLENPRDRGAWWAAVYGVAQSRTWLKRLSSSSKSGLLM